MFFYKEKQKSFCLLKSIYPIGLFELNAALDLDWGDIFQCILYLFYIHFYVEYEIHFDSQTAFDNKVEGFKLLPKKDQLQIFSKN